MPKCPLPPLPPISPILSLCKYGAASEEVGQGSDDWRLGTIFPRYFLPLGKKDISLMEFFNNGSRGWEKDTCPIVDKIVLPATKFGNFRATQLHTLQSCAHLAQLCICMLAYWLKKILLAKTCPTTFINFHRNTYLHKYNCT